MDWGTQRPHSSLQYMADLRSAFYTLKRPDQAESDKPRFRPSVGANGQTVAVVRLVVIARDRPVLWVTAVRARIACQFF